MRYQELVLAGQDTGQPVGPARAAHGQAGQGWGELEPSPAAVSLRQGLTALGTDMGTQAVGGGGSTRGWAGLAVPWGYDKVWGSPAGGCLSNKGSFPFRRKYIDTFWCFTMHTQISEDI